jgi:RNA polymerase sigma factor (sigma-70 family)
MFKPQPQQILYTHEDLFLARYERLLAWAAQLTDHDSQRAEDLVHDVFVKFALSQPDLRQIENLDGYLYTALRNTYRSQIRRAGYDPSRRLGLLDYDSAELGLRAAEPRQTLDAREELRLICQYACLRKESAKAAGVLILRYFLGYFPGEIALILRSERQAVAEALRVARAEARAYVRDPRAIRFPSSGPAPTPWRAGVGMTTEDLLRALWKQIFDSVSGSCASRKELERLYHDAGSSSIEREALAHWVSCPGRLDRINEILGLPSLADRNPVDSAGSDPGSRGGMGDNGARQGGRGSGAGNDRTGEALKRFRRRAQLVYEHEPRELRIVVDGQPAGSQRVGAELNKQTLSLSESEPIQFIEVYSEQGVRMAYMVIEVPPKGAFLQREFLPLSDDRTLDLSLNFKGLRPELEVLYMNPGLGPAGARAGAPERENPGAGFAAAEAVLRDESLRDEIAESRPESESANWRGRLSALLRWLPAAPRMAALLGAVSIAAYLLIGRADQPTVAGLLQRAEAAEASEEERIARQPDEVFHRRIEVEIRGLDGKELSRRTIETWRNARKQSLARRMYDEDGLLLAAEWREAGAAAKLYGVGHGIDSRPSRDANSKDQGPGSSDWATLRAGKMLTTDELWRLDLSTKDFLNFVGVSAPSAIKTVASVAIEDGTQVYEIRYQNLSQSLVSATLTLDRRGLRPIRQEFRLRHGAEDRVVRFVERAVDSRPFGATGGKVFEVEEGLIGAAKTGSAAIATANASGSPAAAEQVAPPASALPPAATAELEIKAMTLLHQAGADLGEEVSLTRGPDGGLKIEAVVVTAQRKTEILGALGPIAGHPAVSIRIETAAEAHRRIAAGARAAEPKDVLEYTAAGATIPAEPILRAYAERRIATGAARLSPDEATRAVDAEIRQVATQLVKRSARALRQAYALNRLSNRFTLTEIQSLNESGRAEWAALAREHTRNFSDETSALRVQLQRVISSGDTAKETPAEVEIKSDQDLLAALGRVFRLASSNDNAIRAAFAAPTERAPKSDVNLTELWQSLRVVEQLSSVIQKRLSVKN